MTDMDEIRDRLQTARAWLTDRKPDVGMALSNIEDAIELMEARE